MPGVAFLRASGASAPSPPSHADGLRHRGGRRSRAIFVVEPQEYHTTPSCGPWRLAATLLDSAMGCAVHSSWPKDGAYTTLEAQGEFVRA